MYNIFMISIFSLDETIDFDETYGVNVQFEESDDDVSTQTSFFVGSSTFINVLFFISQIPFKSLSF